MPHFEKHFTVDEAKAMLPHVVSVFDKIHSIRDLLRARKEELDKLHTSAPGNGGGAGSADLLSFSEQIGRLVGDLEEKGIQIKDVDAALIDFPHMREDREVFLCWKLGEKTIEFWHEIESGFRGRQPLQP